MTICSGGDSCFFGVQIGRWITRDADGSGDSSAPRPARPAQQHPLQRTESSEKAKPAFPTNQPNQRGVVLPAGPPRVAAAGSKSSAARKNHEASQRCAFGSKSQQALVKHPGSLEFSPTVQADPTLGGPDGSAGESARAACQRKKPWSGAVARSTRRHHITPISSWPSVDNLLRLPI